VNLDFELAVAALRGFPIFKYSNFWLESCPST